MSHLRGYQEELLDVLIESGALAFGEFTLKSGRKSPYFFNMGIAISKGSYLGRISRCYCQSIINSIGSDFTFIFGPAYKGIPLAGSIAQTLSSDFGIDARWGYDRKEEKGYGDARDKVLVGMLEDGDKVIMVDDVITTGGTKVEAWNKVRGLAKGLVPKGIFVAVDREEKDESGHTPKESLEKDGLMLTSIITATEIFEHLRGRDVGGSVLVDDELFRSFEEYRKRY